MHHVMMEASPSYRLQHSGVTIDGVVQLDFQLYPFIPEIMDEHAQDITIIKGAQMGFTIACIMRAIEEAKSGSFRGVGYFMPTEGEVSDFTKARFGPMLTNNPDLWGQYVKDTDSSSLKKVNDTFLYFRGAGQRGTTSASKSKSKQKSIPLDRLYLDERDEMDDLSVDALDHRLDGSLSGERIQLSTPTLPGYGVDLDYRRSDQRVWMWFCEKCSDWTCLELTYPDCIAQPREGDPHYLCEHCRKPLPRRTGQWVARKPEVTGHRGYYVSQLSSPTKSTADIILASARAIETGRRREFENQTLARAFAEVDEEITAEQLNALVDEERTRPLQHEGPCAMGVDPGKPHWYTIRARITEKDSQVITMGKADSYEELARIAKQYNVEAGVMDQGYDPSAVAKFCDDHPGWYGCLYTGQKVTDPDWDHREHLVKVGRTRTLDDARNDILHNTVSYPQKTEFWTKHFIPQMTNLKRATIENDRNGDRKAEWVVTGGQKNDHLRHADAYCSLVLGRCGLAKSVVRARTSLKKPSKKKRGAMTL